MLIEILFFFVRSLILPSLILIGGGHPLFWEHLKTKDAHNSMKKKKTGCEGKLLQFASDILVYCSC